MSVREDLLKTIDSMDDTGLAELLSHARALKVEPAILTPDEEKELTEAEAEVARGEVAPLRELRRRRL
ncbi:MAG: hypothetical protein VB144_04720 [Clostridia bacterium]|nr:hypothetical protein [Clostridia bacterium]